MIRFKNESEIAFIRESSRRLAEVLKGLQSLVVPGVTTRELDDFVRENIHSRGGKPAFLGYLGFPASLCISINEEVIHGIPGKRRLQEGDLVGLDVGFELDGFFSDAALTVGVGRIGGERARLLKVTRECLDLAVKEAIAGNRVSDISRAVHRHAREAGFDVVRQFCGHGVGFSPHEDPQIPNYTGSGPNPRLKAGMVLAIEPMVNAGTWEVRILEDDWTVVTVDGSDSAHFEHTVALFEDHTEILTAME
jgi:methionyl aminopeptidase